jgi:hypothetical protein
MSALKLRHGIAALWIAASILPGHAAEQIEAIGAEKCAGRAQAHEVAFLAPDSATVEAIAKVLRRGVALSDPGVATLSIDGKPCTEGRCAFQAKKGETYRLRATTSVRDANDLCIAVTRP